MGSDEDTVESIRNTIDAAIEEDLDYMALFPLSGYPEHNAATIPLNRFFVPTWDRLDGTFVIFLPKKHEAQHTAAGGQPGLQKVLRAAADTPPVHQA